MHLLGDWMIGTEFPLVFRMWSDPKSPRVVEKNGSVKFRVGTVEIECNGVLIRKKSEKNAAFYMMLFGHWVEGASEADVKAGELISIKYTYMPVEPPDDQPFAPIGMLSEMVSRRFNEMTSDSGNVNAIFPAVEPVLPKLLTSRSQKTTELPLWRFRMLPEGSTTAESSDDAGA
jgi:hypothetical protein